MTPSSGVGYHCPSEDRHSQIGEYAQLLPLLEQLVQLVERRGGREIAEDVDETGSELCGNSRFLTYKGENV